MERSSIAVLAIMAAGCSLIAPQLTFGGDADAGRDAATLDAQGPDAADAADSAAPGDADTGTDGGREDAAADAGADDAAADVDGGTDAGACTMTCEGATPICDRPRDRCVQCLEHASCDDGDICTDDRCDADGMCFAVPQPTCIAQLAGGSGNTCARRASGEVLCWGNNLCLQVHGQPENVDQPTAAVITAAGAASGIFAGGYIICGTRPSGAPICWGDISGFCTESGGWAPSELAGATDAVEVAISSGAAARHVCLRRDTGAVVCQGHNSSGQLGRGFVSPCCGAEPDFAPVTGIADAVSVTAGSVHTCAVRTSGQAACWGGCGYGQCGNGSTGTLSSPATVIDLADFTMVAAGVDHTCGLRRGGEVACWGRNQRGQLGDDSVVNSSRPRAVAGLTGVTGLAVGADHGCAMRSDGTVLCWGANEHGQLGNGESGAGLFHSAPVAVSGLTDAVHLAAGSHHTCARRREGEVVCWGRNEFGQLGDGTTMSPRLTPVTVMGL